MDRFEPLKELIDRLYDSRRFHDRQSFEDKTLDLAAGLDAETERRVRAYVVQRAADLPVALTTTKEAQEAEDICRQAAEQLVAADWFNRVLVTWPAPIAHEVQQLTVVLNGDHRAPSPEAALLQLRDVTDTLIKLPAIIFARTLIERGGEDARFARVKMLHQCLLTGVWMDAARELAKRVAKEPQSLAKLANLFVPSHTFATALSALITARNDYLGHAALRANPAETAGIVAWYAAGLQTKTVQLRNTTTLAEGLAAAVNDDPWLGLRLEAEDGDTFIDLTGAQAVTAWDQTRRHKHNGCTLPIRLVMPEEYALELAPYVAARVCEQCKGRDVFLFDTVKDVKKTKVDFQEYAHGHKAHLDQRTAPDMGRELIALPLAGPIILAEDTSQDLESGSVIARLDRARVEHAYLSPGYLREGLARFINETDRGVYWLRAPAHVGKTTFVQGLVLPILGERELAHRLAPGPGGGVAEYFCKKEYREGSISFLNGLATALQNALDIRDDASMLKPEPRQVLESTEKRRALVAWIDQWRVLAKRADSPLLIVIDGLDEADDPAKADSLLHLLPRPGELSAGLYFLLTSRRISDSDCPTWLGATIAPLYASGEHVAIREIGLDDADYVALMRAYAARALGTRSEGAGFEALFSSILKQSEGRFVFVSFLVEQLRAGRVRPEELPAVGNGDEIYGRFLDRLDERYGEKRADDIRMVLATLAAEELAHEWIFASGAKPDLATGGILEPADRAWHGMSLGLLAEATGLDIPHATSRMRRYDTRLVETLLLVQGALGVWRGEAGVARYRLGLKGLSPILTLHGECGPVVVRAHARLAGLTLDAIDAVAKTTEDKIQMGEDDPDLEQFIESGARLAGHVALAGSDPLDRRFHTAPLGTPLNICVRSSKRRAAYRAEFQWYSLSVWWQEASALAHVPADKRDFLAQVCRNGDAAIGLLGLLGETLGKHWLLSWAKELASAYGQRGTAKLSAPGYGPTAAIADYDVAIDLMERLSEALGKDWPAADLVEVLALAYGNRGNAKRDALAYGPAAALADCDAAIGLMERLREALGKNWPPDSADCLAGAYMNRGNAKRSAPGYGPADAIADYDAAISLREHLRMALGKNWPPAWANGLSTAYQNRGNAKQFSKGYGPAAALADCDAAIAIMESLHEALGKNWPADSADCLVTAYINRGNVKQKAPGYGPEAAIADFDVAIGLGEHLGEVLGKDWPPDWANALASAYGNRGNAKLFAPGHGPQAAFADYDTAIDLKERLRETLGKKQPLKLTDDLAMVYANRGKAKLDAPGYGPTAALADYDVAIGLGEDLRKMLGRDWPPDWAEHLANAYLSRGKAKEDAPGYGPAAALADHDTAIGVVEQASGKNWPAELPDFADRLAVTYMVRGLAKEDGPVIHGPDAIADYNAAIGLWEHVREAYGKDFSPEWAEKLARAYNNRGDAKRNTPGYGPADAIADYDAAIGLGERLHEALGKSWPLEWANDVATVYLKRGDAKLSAPGYGPAAAIADYDAAIALLGHLGETLEKDSSPRWANLLSHAYVNRGNTKQSTPGYGPADAIADYDAAIGLGELLREALGKGWSLEWANDLVTVYLKRGDAKQDAPGHGPAAAIADYDAAISLSEHVRETLGKDWSLEQTYCLAGVYMNRGIAKRLAPEYGPAAAIADYDTAIVLKERLREALGKNQPLHWANDLANAYMNLGLAKLEAPGYGGDAAIADYDVAISLAENVREALGKNWPRDWAGGLAGAYTNRGTAKLSAAGYTPAAAVADYDAATGLLESLRFAFGEDQLPAQFYDSLARIYLNAGMVRLQLNDRPKACENAKRAEFLLLELVRRAAGKDTWSGLLAGVRELLAHTCEDVPEGFG